jgi:hypothetical protein
MTFAANSSLTTRSARLYIDGTMLEVRQTGAVINFDSLSVSGTPQVGSELRAEASVDPPDATLTYQWEVDGTGIPGATAATFIPREIDFGKAVAVTVTASKQGYPTVSRTSSAVLIEALPQITIASVGLSGTIAVGNPITAIASQVNPPGATLSYQWLVGPLCCGQNPVPGATSATFTPGPENLGYAAGVAVTATMPGYSPVTVTSPLGILGALSPTSFSVSPTTTYAAPVAGGSRVEKVTVKPAGGYWGVTSSAGWITVSSWAGVGSGEVTISVSPNTGAARQGSVTVGSKTIKVTQAAATVTTPSTSWTAAAAGAVTTSKVTTNQPGWTAASDASWLTITPTSGVSGQTVVWAAEPNRSGAKRTAKVVVSAGEVTRTVTVSQAALTASLSLSRTTWAAPSSAASASMTITTNQPAWSASSDQTWLTVSQATGPGGRIVVVEAQANPASTARTGIITVTAGTVTKTLKVTQAATSVQVNPSGVSWMAPGGGGTWTLSAAPDGGGTWTASESATWLTLSSTRAVAAGGSVTVTASANTTSARRTATVTLKSGKGSATITVVQGSSKTITLSRATWAPAKGGATVTVTVTAHNDATWTASVDQPWVGIGGPATVGGTSLTAVAQPNTGPARTATITITAGPNTTQIPITQPAG